MQHLGYWNSRRERTLNVKLVPEEEKAALLEYPVRSWLDLVELLQRDGLDVSKGNYGGARLDTAAGLKEPVTVILASAAVITSLTPILSKLISSLSRRPVVVSERILVPVEDSSGTIVVDSSGQPIMQWVEKARMVESSTGSND